MRCLAATLLAWHRSAGILWALPVEACLPCLGRLRPPDETGLLLPLCWLKLKLLLLHFPRGCSRSQCTAADWVEVEGGLRQLRELGVEAGVMAALAEQARARRLTIQLPPAVQVFSAGCLLMVPCSSQQPLCKACPTGQAALDTAGCRTRACTFWLFMVAGGWQRCQPAAPGPGWRRGGGGPLPAGGTSACLGPRCSHGKLTSWLFAAAFWLALLY